MVNGGEKTTVFIVNIRKKEGGRYEQPTYRNHSSPGVLCNHGRYEYLPIKEGV